MTLNMSLGVLARTEPLEAMDVAFRRSAGDEQRNALSTVVGGWADTAPRAAAAWFAEQSEPDVRTATAGGIARGYAQADPEEAFEGVSALTPTELDLVGGMVFAPLAQVDSVRASRLVLRMTIVQARIEGATPLVGAWARSDPEAAADWAQTLSNADALLAIALGR